MQFSTPSIGSKKFTLSHALLAAGAALIGFFVFLALAVAALAAAIVGGLLTAAVFIGRAFFPAQRLQPIPIEVRRAPRGWVAENR